MSEIPTIVFIFMIIAICVFVVAIAKKNKTDNSKNLESTMQKVSIAEKTDYSKSENNRYTVNNASKLLNELGKYIVDENVFPEKKMIAFDYFKECEKYFFMEYKKAIITKKKIEAKLIKITGDIYEELSNVENSALGKELIKCLESYINVPAIMWKITFSPSSEVKQEFYKLMENDKPPKSEWYFGIIEYNSPELKGIVEDERERRVIRYKIYIRVSFCANEIIKNLIPERKKHRKWLFIEVLDYYMVQNVQEKDLNSWNELLSEFSKESGEFFKALRHENTCCHNWENWQKFKKANEKKFKIMFNL